MEQNYYQKMSGAIAAAESLRYIGLSLDEVGVLCDVPSSLLEAAIHSVNPDILTMRERIRMMLEIQPATKPGERDVESSQPQATEAPSPIEDFRLSLKDGVRRSSFVKYAPSIEAYATSARSLQRICRDNKVSCNNCRAFMMRYYPEAAQRHVDVLEGRFAVKEQSAG